MSAAVASPPGGEGGGSGDAAAGKEAAAAQLGGGGKESVEGGGPPTVVVGGLQYAAPYDERKVTWIKDRFEGRPLCEVLGEMWRMHRGEQPLAEAAAFWRSEVQGGRVEYRGRKRKIDDPNYEFRPPDPDLAVEKGASLRILRHVHERVVPEATVRVLWENERVLAIDKPAGHATLGETVGPNSLLGIVSQATGWSCHPAHRLDKPVSGVLLLGKSKGKAAKLLSKISQKEKVTKVYVARVQRARAAGAAGAADAGSFGEEAFTVCAALRWAKGEGGAEARSEVVEGEALSAEKAVRERAGRSMAALATTSFRRLCTMPDGTLVVECRPLTGQRHQIRAHLAHIGWPIANDGLYGGSLPAEGDERTAYQDDAKGTLAQFYGAPRHWRDWCPKCAWTRGLLEPGTERVPPPVGGGAIWLHALRYVIPDAGIDVTAPLPRWAEAAEGHV